MEKVIDLVGSKISEGDSLLQALDTMRKRSGPAMNIAYYVDEDVERLRKDISKWQLTSKEILISGFGETHRYVSSFENTITQKNSGFDFKREFKFEVNRGLETLESIEETLKLNLDIVKSVDERNPSKLPMVFISHSSKDKNFVEALVDLLEGIGFDRSNLFCSSIEGYGIGLSEDIFETLRSLFNNYNLFVIFIHSPRYYMSTISLNEMGAAWVLKTDFCSFLTTDMGFNQMTGVVNGRTLSIKVDEKDAYYRLTELKDKLIQMFQLDNIDGGKWERKRNIFLKIVNEIDYSIGDVLVGIESC